MKKLIAILFLTTQIAGCGGRQKVESDFFGGGKDTSTSAFNQDGGGFGLALTGTRAAPEKRIRMLLTALAFDRSLARRSGEIVHIATVGECPTAHRLHQSQGEQHGLRVRLHTAPPSATAAGLGEWVREKGIKVLYLCSVPSEAQALARILEADSVTTLADDPTWVGSFASMGIVERDGHPRLLVNLENARAAGMVFDSSVYASSVLIAN